jgi:hypothetical protein
MQSVNKRDHVVNAVLLSLGVVAVFEFLSPRAPAAPSPATAAVAVAGEFVRYGVPVTLGALFPDVDTHFGRHRKTFHNAAVLGVFVAYPLVFDNLELVWLGVLTHLVLDFAGSGRGIAILYPLSDREFALPGGVPTSSRWAPLVTAAITAVEVALVATIHVYVVPLDGTVADAARSVAASLA